MTNISTRLTQFSFYNSLFRVLRIIDNETLFGLCIPSCAKSYHCSRVQAAEHDGVASIVNQIKVLPTLDVEQHAMYANGKIKFIQF